MTVESLERANKIKYDLHFISEAERFLSIIEESCADEFSFSNRNYSVPIDRELAGKLMPIIREYYQEQVAQLEKEFEKL